jgi:hypothetical protein
MTRELIDVDTFNGTVTTGTNETLEVNTSRAEDVIIFVDDGTTDNQPQQYSMIERVFNSSIGDYQFYDAVSGENARSWIDSAWGEKMQFEFNNTSGSNSTYRIVISSYRTIQ